MYPYQRMNSPQLTWVQVVNLVSKSPHHQHLAGHVSLGLTRDKGNQVVVQRALYSKLLGRKLKPLMIMMQLQIMVGLKLLKKQS